ncbi:TPA: 16S rRNA (guanine(966)-N(2))-methyltransferase RsmD [Klebsiella pneumoniae]
MKARQTGSGGQLRIIAGQWRSRRFGFPDAPGLRPTPDRVRETLFNWLAPWIEGAHLLDCFTGSGAMSLEALSRDAARVLALDLNPQAVANLRGHLQTLGCERGEVRQTDSLSLLQQPASETFDLAFVDPPFHQNLLADCCRHLEANGWLKPRAWIYCESETAPSSLDLPSNWRLHREKKTGQVHYSLWQRQTEP